MSLENIIQVVHPRGFGGWTPKPVFCHDGGLVTKVVGSKNGYSTHLNIFYQEKKIVRISGSMSGYVTNLALIHQKGKVREVQGNSSGWRTCLAVQYKNNRIVQVVGSQNGFKTHLNFEYNGQGLSQISGCQSGHKIYRKIHNPRNLKLNTNALVAYFLIADDYRKMD